MDHLQESEREKYIYQQISSIKIVLILMLFSNTVYQIVATISQNKPPAILTIYWIIWVILLILLILDRYQKKVLPVRILLHLSIIRNTMSLYEMRVVEDFKIEEGYLFINLCAIGVSFLLLCVFLSERLAFAGPMNVIYCFFLVIGVSLQLSYF